MIAKPFPRLWDFSETLVRAIIHREKTSNSVKSSKEWRACQNYPKTTLTTHLGHPKKSRTTSKESQASLASVKVHDSTIIKQMALKTKWQFWSGLVKVQVEMLFGITLNRSFILENLPITLDSLKQFCVKEWAKTAMWKDAFPVIPAWLWFLLGLCYFPLGEHFFHKEPGSFG